MFPLERHDEAKILKLQSGTQQLWYFPSQPTPGRKVHGKRGQHSPPLVKLFENGMSKWTGAIFGILDVLLSMPKKLHTGHHSVRNRKVDQDDEDRRVTNHPQTRKQTGYKSSLNLSTFNLQMLTIWIIMFDGWITNNKDLPMSVCLLV